MKKNKILLHVCCGPCSTYPLAVLAAEYNVQGYFYNPNIHPYREFKKRLRSTQKLYKREGFPLCAVTLYPLDETLNKLLTASGGRCQACYNMRMESTARYAAEKNIGRFTTTLLISPYQCRERLLSAGEAASRKWGVEFIGFDFREGYRRSRQMAKELDLYRQSYCGCIFSEKERYYRSEENG